jgi:hypothetical protein
LILSRKRDHESHFRHNEDARPARARRAERSINCISGIMAKQRMREVVWEFPSEILLRQRASEGWRLAGLEWEREAADGVPSTLDDSLEVPYGLQVAADGVHLVDNPAERAALMVMMDLIADDAPLSEVVAALNKRGMVTRAGASWTAPEVFNLLPRMVETGPRIFARQDWIAQRESKAPAAV